MLNPNALMNGNSETKWGKKDKAKTINNHHHPPQNPKHLSLSKRAASSADNIEQKHEKQNILSEEKIHLRK